MPRTIVQNRRPLPSAKPSVLRHRFFIATRYRAREYALHRPERRVDSEVDELAVLMATTVGRRPTPSANYTPFPLSNTPEAIDTVELQSVNRSSRTSERRAGDHWRYAQIRALVSLGVFCLGIVQLTQ